MGPSRRCQHTGLGIPPEKGGRALRKLGGHSRFRRRHDDPYRPRPRKRHRIRVSDSGVQRGRNREAVGRKTGDTHADSSRKTHGVLGRSRQSEGGIDLGRPGKRNDFGMAIRLQDDRRIRWLDRHGGKQCGDSAARCFHARKQHKPHIQDPGRERYRSRRRVRRGLRDAHGESAGKTGRTCRARRRRTGHAFMGRPVGRFDREVAVCLQDDRRLRELDRHRRQRRHDNTPCRVRPAQRDDT